MPTRRALLGLICVCLSSCCTTREQVHTLTTYRLELDTPEDQSCFRRCAPLRLEGRESYAQCLEACPGTRVDHYPCAGEEPPKAECVATETTRERVVRRSSFAEGVAVGAVIGFGAIVAIVAGGKKQEQKPETQ